MTFDEWFAAKGCKEEHREIMKCGWEGAIRNYPLNPQRREIDNITVGSQWIVRVKGGTYESLVKVTHIKGGEIWLCTPSANAKHGGTNHRRRRLEDLEFLSKVSK